MAKLIILAFEALGVYFSCTAPMLTHTHFPGRNFHHRESALICDTHFPGEHLAFFTGIPVCLRVLEMGQSFKETWLLTFMQKMLNCSLGNLLDINGWRLGRRKQFLLNLSRQCNSLGMQSTHGLLESWEVHMWLPAWLRVALEAKNTKFSTWSWLGHKEGHTQILQYLIPSLAAWVRRWLAVCQESSSYLSRYWSWLFLRVMYAKTK